SIGGLFSAMAKGMDIGRVIEKGDIAVILPSMYTGNTDLENTVLGYTPRGFLLVSYINSVLKGNWIHFSKWIDYFLSLAIMAFVLFFLTRRSSLVFYSSVLALVLLIGAASILIYQ